ncbi:MAG TPA: ATP-binding protein [Stellaceae bacterium]|nr:ATP-binding protein [Stellaceae bacterium]
MMSRLTIRARLILLTSMGLLVLIATNFYLNRKLAENSAGMVKAAELLGVIEQANGAQIAFGKMRYWMTDLAVSLLMLSEHNAHTALARMETNLDQLARYRPQAVTAVRSELEQYQQLAHKAVDEYTDDHRVIGNSLLAQASEHSVIVDRQLAAIVAESTREAIAAREQVVADAAEATRLSRIVVSAAVLVGAVLTLLVLRSIAVPLRRLVVAMNGLNAGDLAVSIPPAGPDEIGAMAHTLAAFRDTLEALRKLINEQRQRESELRAAHDQLKAAQANLIQAEKMASLGQLTAGIAHEIKNPLNFVNNFAELSRELLGEVKEAVDANPAANGTEDLDELIVTLDSNLAKIAEHGRRADGIVKSMLLHSRGGSGERRQSDLNALIEEALNLAYHGARAQDQGFNVTLERDFDPNLGPVETVPQDITRVFLNLFGNAFYAVNLRRRESGNSGFAPTLTLTTRNLGDAIEVRVRDNGTGIPPEVRDKLFQPFFTTKPTGEGTGLGLSISYDIIVQEHGGTIAVDSRQGEFTEFTIHLPHRPAAAAPAVATGASA